MLKGLVGCGTSLLAYLTVSVEVNPSNYSDAVTYKPIC